MTPERLAEIKTQFGRSKDLMAPEISQLIDEVERLRGLVKDAELNGRAQWGYSGCPWCGELWNPDAKNFLKHGKGCPAFTPTGEVK